MAYKGKYTPLNKKKYVGNPNKIIYRSLWERKFMKYCDENDAIIAWASEEIIIPYISPVDNRIHKYFPDFFIKVEQKDRSIKHILIEIKPKIQCSPPKVARRKTKYYLNEVKTWNVNQAKWKAAKEWCLDRKFEFKLITEKELGI
tara:strand:+ start:133 stop:567 length:435 start_codon:yes stop_codon:yes gene_type:complete